MKRVLNKFTVLDLVIIALMAGLGLAMKPIIVPLIHIITGPLFIPGGSVAGGFYMMWIIIGMALVRKHGTCTLVAVVQGVMVLIMGSIGNHGIASIITYALPGICAEIPFFFRSKSETEYNILHYLCAGICANLAGTYGSNLLFFNLPAIPLLVSLSAAAVSGGLGGIIAYNLSNTIGKHINMEM